MTLSSSTVFETDLKGLERLHRGKVRDIYALDAQRLLIVTTDRLSAFDVVLPDPIPGKGHVLDEISRFWFARTASLIPNHLTGQSLASVVRDPADLELLEGRAVIVKRLRALPLEAVVRGYLIGSGWKDYQASGSLCGIALPAGLRQAQQLPTPLFTPATKAPRGSTIRTFPSTRSSGSSVHRWPRQCARPRWRSMPGGRARARARHHHRRHQIRIRRRAKGQLTLIDEVLTPDSSRFWPADTWRVGTSPPSFDKQFVRDYLETLDWNKRAPGPHLPPDIIARTSENYREALRRLTSADGRRCRTRHLRTALPTRVELARIAWGRLCALPDQLLFGPASRQPGLRGAAAPLARYPYALLRDLAEGSSICTLRAWCTRACCRSFRCWH